VEVNLSNRIVDLVADRYDLAFRASNERLKDSSLMARRVTTMAMQLFASPTYLARKGTPRSPRELADHDWVLFRKAGPLKLQGPGEVATVEMKGRLYADDLFFVREAARAGAGVAALPGFLSERDVETGELVRLLPKWDGSAGTLWVVTPGGAHLAKKTVAFRDFALDYLRSHPVTPFVA
jgi:DNA-binding transcriptional LysR family regulator